MAWPSSFRSLRHRNFRLFWFGQCISLIGTWMQSVAQGWLVLQLTNSSFKLGLLVTAQFLPVLLISLVAGVLIDRYRKRNILLTTQILLALQATILWVLVWTHLVQYWHVLIMAVFAGIVMSFDMPTRQAYVIELVGREDVMNGVALNSSIFNLARILGPAVAGVVMARFGMSFCFGLNALSFLAVIIGISFIPAGERVEGLMQRAIWQEIKSAVRYIAERSILRDALLLLGVLSIFSMNFNVLIPPLAKFTMNSGSQTLGFLMSMMGGGALLASLMIATFSKHGVRRRLLIIGAGVLALAELALGFVRLPALAGAALFVCGWGMVIFNSSVNTTLQMHSADLFRGRVMSVYALFLAGLAPIGSLAAGSVAQWAGPPMGFAGGAVIGLVAILVMFVIWRRRKPETVSVQ